MFSSIEMMRLSGEMCNFVFRGSDLTKMAVLVKPVEDWAFDESMVFTLDKCNAKTQNVQLVAFT